MTPVQSGLVYIFTGEGKGKTSAALGTAIRALAAGKTVTMIQWYKDPTWDVSEYHLKEMFTPKISSRFILCPMGRGFHITTGKTAPLSNGGQVIDKASETDHQEAAKEALAYASSLLAANPPDVLILDEINNALADNLIQIDDVISMLRKRQSTHVILTGRDADSRLIKIADLVTEMKKIKHPYDQGKLAVKGLDF